MKTAADIISYLDAELEDTYKQCKYWKNIDSSEAAKYIVKAHTIEDILDQVAQPDEQPETEERIAKCLVSDPREKKPKRTFKEIYLNIFGFVMYFTSCVVICLFIDSLLERLGISGFISGLLCYGYGLLHTGSYALMLFNSHLLIKTEKSI